MIQNSICWKTFFVEIYPTEFHLSKRLEHVVKRQLWRQRNHSKCPQEKIACY